MTKKKVRGAKPQKRDEGLPGEPGGIGPDLGGEVGGTGPKGGGILTAKEAAAYLRISLFTLRKLEEQGLIVPYRTPGRHRRYTLEMLNKHRDKLKG